MATITIRRLALTPRSRLTEGGQQFHLERRTAGGRRHERLLERDDRNNCHGQQRGHGQSDIASNLKTAITNCNTSFPAVGLSASYSSVSTLTVSNPTPGPFLAVGGTSLTGLFSWGTVSGGSAGSNACSGTSGTSATAPSGTNGNSANGLRDLASSAQPHSLPALYQPE